MMHCSSPVMHRSTKFKTSISVKFPVESDDELVVDVVESSLSESEALELEEHEAVDVLLVSVDF